MSSCACIHVSCSIIDVKNKKLLLHSITVTTKSSKKNGRKHVNKKFHKLERVYRDCIKKDKRQDFMMHPRRLIHSDQTRKDGISEPMIQALYYDFVANYVKTRMYITCYVQCNSGDTIPCEGA